MKYEEIWLNYRTPCETLKKEPYLMKTELYDYSQCDNKFKLFIDRGESLMSRKILYGCHQCHLKTKNTNNINFNFLPVASCKKVSESIFVASSKNVSEIY